MKRELLGTGLGQTQWQGGAPAGSVWSSQNAARSSLTQPSPCPPTSPAEKTLPRPACLPALGRVSGGGGPRPLGCSLSLTLPPWGAPLTLLSVIPAETETPPPCLPRGQWLQPWNQMQPDRFCTALEPAAAFHFLFMKGCKLQEVLKDRKLGALQSTGSQRVGHD